jgi:excisionase family DNA binding protein
MLTPGEVAEVLHIHTNTLRRWGDKGKIAAYRTNPRGDRRYRLQDVGCFRGRFNPAQNNTSGKPREPPELSRLLSSASCLARPSSLTAAVSCEGQCLRLAYAVYGEADRASNQYTVDQLLTTVWIMVE